MNLDELFKDLNKIPDAKKDLLYSLQALTDLVKCKSHHDLFKNGTQLSFNNREYFFSKLKENVTIITDSKNWIIQRNAHDMLAKLKDELDDIGKVE